MIAMALFTTLMSPPPFTAVSRSSAYCSSYPLLNKKFILSSVPSLRVPRLPSPKKKIRDHRRSTLPFATVAFQSNWFKVLQASLRVGKDGIEAGTNLVPAFIPRSIARIGIAIVSIAVSLFVLKSVLSTAFFVLAMMGFIYFVYIALNKDEGPKNGGSAETSDEETLEEARRIMEKYK